jgi:hypothetical protein
MQQRVNAVLVAQFLAQRVILPVILSQQAGFYVRASAHCIDFLLVASAAAGACVFSTLTHCLIGFFSLKRHCQHLAAVQPPA